jgi:hypothetical protein
LQHQFPTSKIISKSVDITNQFLFNLKKTPAFNIQAATKEKINNLYSSSILELGNLFAKYNMPLQKKNAGVVVNMPEIQKRKSILMVAMFPPPIVLENEWLTLQ